MDNPVIIFNGLIEAFALLPILLLWSFLIIFILMNLKAVVKDLITHWYGLRLMSTNKAAMQKSIHKNIEKLNKENE